DILFYHYDIVANATTRRAVAEAPRLRRGSTRQRIGPELDVRDLRPRAFAAFHVEGRAGRRRRPQALAFPAAVRIVDAAVHPFRVEAQRIRDAYRDEAAVHEREQAVVEIA